MKLLCTIQRSGFTLNGQTVESHRLYFDFLTRVGIDGHTPEIGSNGNWWIGGKDTGTAASSLRVFRNVQGFPNVGNPAVLYMDREGNKLYRWDDADLLYYTVGADYNDIRIINGGNATTI